MNNIDPALTVTSAYISEGENVILARVEGMDGSWLCACGVLHSPGRCLE